MDGTTLLGLCVRELRAPTSYDSTDSASFVWDPPLTSQEQATLADLQLMAQFGITASLTLAEFQAIKPDLALGKTFLGIASPTTAQAVAAEKAIIRVIGALLRS